MASAIDPHRLRVPHLQHLRYLGAVEQRAQADGVQKHRIGLGLPPLTGRQAPEEVELELTEDSLKRQHAADLALIRYDTQHSLKRALLLHSHLDAITERLMIVFVTEIEVHRQRRDKWSAQEQFHSSDEAEHKVLGLAQHAVQLLGILRAEIDAVGNKGGVSYQSLAEILVQFETGVMRLQRKLSAIEHHQVQGPDGVLNIVDKQFTRILDELTELAKNLPEQTRILQAFQTASREAAKATATPHGKMRSGHAGIEHLRKQAIEHLPIHGPRPKQPDYYVAS